MPLLLVVGVLLPQADYCPTEISGSQPLLAHNNSSASLSK